MKFFILELEKTQKEWISGMEASRKLNITFQNIYACCKGNMKTVNGFIWKYKE